MMKRVLGLLVAWLIVELLPRMAAACAVCTAGRDDETNQAFLISTIFMSILPLAGLGTLVFVIWRRMRALEARAVHRTTPGGTTSAKAEAAPSAAPVLAGPTPAR
ncbi:MAG: hypothetical protein R3F35_12395 [Myxococcota bacterium]